MNGLKILEHAGEGYTRLVNGAKWTLACLNYAARFDEKNIVDLERHNLTDETFVLLQGQATLLMAEARRELSTGEAAAKQSQEWCAPETFATRPRVAIGLTRIPLEPLKYYNVGAGVWHNIIVSKDARVLVGENADTSKENTDYLEIATGRVFRKRPSFEEVLPDTYLLKVPFGPVWTGVVLVLGRHRQGEDASFTERGAQGEDALPTEGGTARCGKGVLALAERNGCANVLIDSSHLEPEKYLIPALEDLGMKISDIDWLLNTHVHGDHIGGHHTLVTKYGLKTATLGSAADALRDPVKVAIRVRTRFPKNSPAPQSYLKGVEPDLLLEEWTGMQGGDALPTGGTDVARASSPLRNGPTLLAGRFAVIATPGHDDDCLTWIDTKTGTAFTGDSLQANGTPTQGIGFYRSLPDYRATLQKLKRLSQGADGKSGGQGVPALAIRNIVCGHDYDGIGDVIRGAEKVKAALDYCEGRVGLYGERLRVYLSEAQGGDALPTGRAQDKDALPTCEDGKSGGQGVPALASDDESLLVPLALRLIGEVGCGMPDALFLALHTVSEHLKEMSHD